MEYIDFEAEEILKEEEIISFSGEENDEDNISFIEDGKVENQEPSFYRKFLIKQEILQRQFTMTINLILILGSATRNVLYRR